MGDIVGRAVSRRRDARRGKGMRAAARAGTQLPAAVRDGSVGDRPRINVFFTFSIRFQYVFNRTFGKHEIQKQLFQQPRATVHRYVSNSTITTTWHLNNEENLGLWL